MFLDTTLHFLGALSIVVNGFPKGFFSSSRGLRQGDPLSLFVFVMEALSRMISAAVLGGLLEGFTVDNTFVSHLLFADDILIFCNSMPAQLSYLRSLFLLFEAASDLKVNLTKSTFIPVKNVEQVDSSVCILRCGVATLSVKYLGFPLGASFKAKHIWDGVIEKIEHRLASWKMLYLSKGGRVTIIKSTPANMPTYYLSLFPLPVSVAKHIEKLQCNLLWGGMGEEFKYHLVKWSKVCTLIKEGGFGIRNLLMFNRALLGKWLWRYGLKRDARWRVVVDSKFGSLWGGWCSLEPRGAFGLGLLNYIRKGWVTFKGFTRFVAGDGTRVSFGDMALKIAFLILFSIACVKDASGAGNLEVLGGSNQWNVSFSRETHDWEVDVFASFFLVLHVARVR